MTLVLSDDAVTVNDAAAVSTSPMVKLTVIGLFCVVVLLAMAEIVGKSLTELTVSRKLWLKVLTPSVALIVMVVCPKALGNEVSLMVRLAPSPARTMLVALFGTSAVLDDVALTTMVPGGNPGSLTVNGIARVGTSSFVTWSGMGEIAEVLMVKTERPRVAAASSSRSASNCKSTTGTLGKPRPKRFQLAAPSSDTKTPRSVAT